MFDDDEREHMPLEAREIHHRLLDDSSQWVRKLPSDASVAEFARALPRRMPSPSARSTHNVLAHRRPSSTLPDMMSVKGQPYMLKIEGPRRTIAASIAAVAVVALIVGVLYTMHTMQGTRAGTGSVPAVATLTPAPTLTPGAYGVYGATPGAQAKYIANIVTARGRSSEGNPTQVTSHFVQGDWVYVVATTHNLPKGTHVISIDWYINGISTEMPNSGNTSLTISTDKKIVFGLQYPTSGLGVAKLFIDRPANDTSESPDDPYLAEAITFSVAPASTPTQGNSTPTPTVFIPTATPHPSFAPTATPHPPFAPTATPHP